ncbi:transposable element Tcb1 transposase [Trichonephila clavipes]|nr:transposable element Tcb1 transposase [Trichonephila clavipes]
MSTVHCTIGGGNDYLAVKGKQSIELLADILSCCKRRRKARVPRVCVPLSVQSRGAQLKWCREQGNWTVSDWGNVMFTDESRFALEPADKCKRIWCKQGTRSQPQNIIEHHAFRGGSLMVCAGISIGYRTDLHIFKL